MPPKLYVDAPPNGDFRAMPARGGGLAIVKWVTSFPGNPARGPPGRHRRPARLQRRDRGAARDPRHGRRHLAADRRGGRSLGPGAGQGRCERPRASSAAASTARGRPAVSPRSATGRASAPTLSPEAAAALATELGWETGSIAEALACDVAVTVTPGDRPVVTAGLLRPGTHLAVLGADGHGKAEVEAAAIDRCRLFCDQWEQASTGGELAGPVERGQVGRGTSPTSAPSSPGRRGPAVRRGDHTVRLDRTRDSGSRDRDRRRRCAAAGGRERLSCRVSDRFPVFVCRSPGLSPLSRVHGFMRLRTVASSLTAALFGALLLSAGAQGADRKPTFAVRSGDSLQPAFSPKVHDYAARCNDRDLSLRVRGARAGGRRLDHGESRPGQLRLADPAQVGSGGADHLRADRRRLRPALPHPLHPEEVQRVLLQTTAQRRPEVLLRADRQRKRRHLRRNGVPVWWRNAGGSGADAKLLPDGTISWNTGSGVIAGSFDVSTLSGRTAQAGRVTRTRTSMACSCCRTATT